ncbi:Kinase, NEK [Giardia lamblia P15]|uniref:non-specific serine/threonine protein kinase n=1 Tax=Giardia intestinalis (strain P15) TaxID=658858 RepID=E1F2N0_GIAIA|nr:Kinase, NEK [Giardia lamblia P15]
MPNRAGRRLKRMPDPIDALIDDLDAELGSGAHGIVYGLKSAPDRAVKEIPTDGLSPDAQASLEVELRTLPRLRHPNVVEYKRVVRHEGYIYIEMRRYAGSLDGAIRGLRRRRQLPPREMVIGVLRQVGAGLRYLHSAGKTDADGAPLPAITHCDLRPANILLDQDEAEFAISDFGLCREGPGGLVSMAVPVYAAPEVLRGGSHTPASDMWSLGMVVYELAAGGRPQFLSGRAPAEVYVEGWRPDLGAVGDPVVRGVLAHLLVLEPERRLTAAALTELLDAEGGAPAVAVALRFKALEDEVARLRDEVAGLRAALGPGAP